jgi:hypothetical protein
MNLYSLFSHISVWDLGNRDPVDETSGILGARRVQ